MDVGYNLLGTDWDDFKSLMNDAHATFSGRMLIWLKFGIKINRYQEDIDNIPSPTPIELSVLLNYNYRRGWPINVNSASGEDDDQSIQVLINKDYLRQNNFLTVDGNLDYDAGTDYFLLDGVKYKAFGDTPASQMLDDDVFITIIIRRVKLETGG